MAWLAVVALTLVQRTSGGAAASAEPDAARRRCGHDPHRDDGTRDRSRTQLPADAKRRACGCRCSTRRATCSVRSARAGGRADALHAGAPRAVPADARGAIGMRQASVFTWYRRSSGRELTYVARPAGRPPEDADLVLVRTYGGQPSRAPCWALCSRCSFAGGVATLARGVAFRHDARASARAHDGVAARPGGRRLRRAARPRRPAGEPRRRRRALRRPYRTYREVFEVARHAHRAACAGRGGARPDSSARARSG